MTARCIWCGDEIPATMRKGVRYCSRKCSKDANRGKQTGKPAPRPTAGMFAPSVLALRLKERERQVLADRRDRAA